MKRRICMLAATGAGLMGMRAGFADNLNIIVTPTGTSYYQIGVGSGSGEVFSSWTPEVANSEATFNPPANSWDSMVTTPGTASGTGTSVGQTTAFPLSSMSFDGLSFPNSWHDAGTGNTEGALIIAGGTSSSSLVSQLLVLDGPGDLYLYNAPTLSGTTVQSKAVATAGVAPYGYVGSATASYNPGSGTPITELGGLNSDLDWNAGFNGNGANTNIGVAYQEQYFGISGVPNAPNGFVGYEFSGANQPNQVFDDLTSTYLTPTVYYEVAAVPLPGIAETACVLLGAVGVAGYWRSMKRRQAPVV